MREEEVMALVWAGNANVSDLEDIADQIQEARHAIEIFAADVIEKLREKDITENDFSDDLKELLSTLDSAYDDLDDIATWSVSTMGERIAESYKNMTEEIC